MVDHITEDAILGLPFWMAHGCFKRFNRPAVLIDRCLLKCTDHQEQLLRSRVPSLEKPKMTPDMITAKSHQETTTKPKELCPNNRQVKQVEPSLGRETKEINFMPMVSRPEVLRNQANLSEKVIKDHIGFKQSEVLPRLLTAFSTMFSAKEREREMLERAYW